MRQLTTLIIALFFLTNTHAQDDRQLVQRTFKSTRVINTHSVETLPKRKLDFRIGHRFGDLAGAAGGWQTFYGLENASDVLIGFQYGITDRLTTILTRTKGAGIHRAILNAQLKYRLLWQNPKMPISVTALIGTGYSTMSRSDTPTAYNYFEQYAHRFSYVYQLHIARKFGDRLSLQITPSLTHLNIALPQQPNDLYSLGTAARIQLTKVYALLLDYTLVFQAPTDTGGRNPLGIGLEIDTGGHTFQINLTNATGMGETDYLPYTNTRWADGQFRLGFTISRLFNL